MRPPEARGGEYPRAKLLAILNLALAMEVGDCAEISLPEAGTLRVMLLAMGYRCQTDGWRCDTKGKILAFKLHQNVA
jgi:hypothetical protein